MIKDAAIIITVFVLQLSDCSQKENLEPPRFDGQWVLVNYKDDYGLDSIPIGQVFGAKELIFFGNDSVGYGLKNNIRHYNYKFFSDTLLLYSKEGNIEYLKLLKAKDSLILMEEGRHGMTREYYIKSKHE